MFRDLTARSSPRARAPKPRHGGNPSTFARFSHARAAVARECISRTSDADHRQARARPQRQRAARHPRRRRRSPGRHDSLPRTEVVTAPTDEARQALRELNADPDVVYAELDSRGARVCSSESTFRSQWALNNTGQQTTGYRPRASPARPTPTWTCPRRGPRARGSGQHGRGRRHGCRTTTHPDLAGQPSRRGYDWVDRDAYPIGRRTATARTSRGIIAALATTGGVGGVAPGGPDPAAARARRDGHRLDSDVAEAFDFAGDQGVRVVNASLARRRLRPP